MLDDRARKLIVRYNSELDAYQELWAPALRVAGIRLLDEFAGMQPGRVLDVGAGVGVLLPEMRKAFPGADVIGCDVTDGMIGRAPEAFPRSVMTARGLALTDNSVDIVTHVFMLFHMENPVEALKESRRVLRDGGRIGIITWGQQKDADAEVVWAKTLDDFEAPESDTLPQSLHHLVDTPGKMTALLEAAGFTSVRSWTENLTCADTLDQFIRIKTNMGHQKPRYDALDPAAQQAFLAEARRRLDTPDFASVSQIVYTVAAA